MARFCHLQADGYACITEQLVDVLLAVVIKNGYWLTLGIKFVAPDDSVKEVVEYLLKQLQGLEIEIKYVYLDRGFEGVEVARYLKQIKQTAIIACPLRGKSGGVKALWGEAKLSREARFQKRETRS